MGKNIAVVINQYIGGGAERVTDIVVSELISRGHKATLIVSELAEHLFSHANRTYSDIKFLPGLGRYNRNVTVKIASILSEISAEALILLVDDYPDIELLRKAMSPGAPIIFHPHNTPFYQVRAKTSSPQPLKNGILTDISYFLFKKLPEVIFHKYSKRYRKRALQTASEVDAYLLLTNGDTELMRRLFHEYADKFITMPNPLSCSIPTSLPDKQKEIVYIGRLDPIQKRVDRLLTIFAKTRDEFPDWRLKIIGNGPDEQRLKSIANVLNIADCVDFIGYDANPGTYLSNASILCLTSEYEGCSLVLAEAMAYHCVPISFDCGNGPHELLSDGRGFLVQPYSIECYATTLMNLMRSPELCATTYEKHDRFITALSNHAICDKWEHLLEL